MLTDKWISSVDNHGMNLTTKTKCGKDKRWILIIHEAMRSILCKHSADLCHSRGPVCGIFNLSVLSSNHKTHHRLGQKPRTLLQAYVQFLFIYLTDTLPFSTFLEQEMLFAILLDAGYLLKCHWLLEAARNFRQNQSLCDVFGEISSDNSGCCFEPEHLSLDLRTALEKGFQLWTWRHQGEREWQRDHKLYFQESSHRCLNNPDSLKKWWRKTVPIQVLLSADPPFIKGLLYGISLRLSSVNWLIRFTAEDLRTSPVLASIRGCDADGRFRGSLGWLKGEEDVVTKVTEAWTGETC